MGKGKYNLLNIINHRGDEFLAGVVDPMFFITKDGDYVQQSAIAGSDAFAKTGNEQILNKQLDRILGKGADVDGLLDKMKVRMRVPHYGRTIVQDFYSV